MVRLEVPVVHHLPALTRLDDEAGTRIAGLGHRAHGGDGSALSMAHSSGSKAMGGEWLTSGFAAVCSPNCSPAGFGSSSDPQKSPLNWWAVQDSNL